MLRLRKMGVIERSAVVAASPKTIFDLYAPARWPSWDADIKTVENVPGDGRLVQGLKCGMSMANGMKFVATFPEVVENESFVMKARLAGGLATCEMSHKLEQDPSGGTKIIYRFGITGFLGGLFQLFTEKEWVRGTEDGLQAIKKMAEAAENRMEEAAP